jgi:hypothetical protein
MPLASFLLHPSSGDVMARQRELLYETATTLAGRMTITCFTSKILETQLEDAIRYLASAENLPAQKLCQKMSRTNKLLATITDAVVVHCAQCAEHLRISTPPGNPASGRSVEYQREAPEIRGGIRHTGASKRLEYAGGKHKR